MDNKDSRSIPDSDFSYGLRELRRAHLAQNDPVAATHKPGKLPLENQGSDPYNTSGSFDRKKNWSRVGKR